LIRASKAARSLFRVSRAAAWVLLLSWAGAALAFASTVAAQSQEVATSAPAPPASAPSREAPHWVVRVASFYKQENVAEGAERLKKAGFPVVI
jgi:cell division septation protein DedD